MEKKKVSILKNKWFWIIVLPLAIIYAVVSGDSEEANPKIETVEKLVNWDEMNSNEKQEWMEAYFKSPDDKGYALVTQMQNAVKKQFNNPSSVSFSMSTPLILDRAYVVDEQQGFAFVNGSGTAKNGFGVKQDFKYRVKIKVTPNIASVQEAFVD